MRTVLCAVAILAMCCVAANDETPGVKDTREVTFRSIAPTLPVRDVTASLRFYRDVLGFRVEHAAEEPPVYAVIRRDDVWAHLVRDPDKAGHGGCWITVAGVDAVYAALDRANADFARRIEDSPYGMRDFVVKDPDGNTLGIGEPIKKETRGD